MFEVLERMAAVSQNLHDLTTAIEYANRRPTAEEVKTIDRKSV
jgi:hypothetical protein